MNKFSQVAKKETQLSPVMEGREKISMKEIKKDYDGVVTIVEFDFITTNDPKKGESTFPVFAIAEDEGLCFFGGELLNRIARNWASLYDGDIEAASNALKESGGVKVKLESKTTKGGRDFTAVTVLDG